MHISNRFVFVCNIQIVIRMLKWYVTVLQVWILGLFNGEIGSRLQIALFFLFYQKFQHPPTLIWSYLIFLPPVYLGTKITQSPRKYFSDFFLQYSQLLLCLENLRHQQTIFGPVIGLIRSNTGSKLKNSVAYQNSTCILTCAFLPPFARVQSTSGSILTRQIILTEWFFLFERTIMIRCQYI